MAEYVKVIEEYNRMCHYYKVDCRKCPLSSVVCERALFDTPEETESTIMQWAREHPVVYPRVRDVINAIATMMGARLNNFEDKDFIDQQITKEVADRFNISPINEYKLK